MTSTIPRVPSTTTGQVLPIPAPCLLLLLVSLLILWSPSAAAQEINIRNANFYLVQTDLRVQKPGAALEMVRTYNSRSNDDGLLGYGWSTPFDVSIRIHADGSLILVDSDGFVLRYTLDGRPWSEITAAFVRRLVQARRDDDIAHGAQRDDSFYTDLERTWLDDASQREQVTWLYSQAWVEPVDGEYISYDRGMESMFKKGDTYERRRSDGFVEQFNAEGRLVRQVDPTGQGLRLDYDREHRLSKVAHTSGGSFTLTYDKQNRVEKLRDTEGRVVTFTYDSEGNLSRVQGPGSRAMAYAYDEEHNLVAMRAPDGSGVQVRYDQEKDWATAIKVGEEVTGYVWEVLDEAGQHYVCTVTSPDGSVARHEFDQESRVTVVTEPDGSTTRTTYSACCDQPLEIRYSDGNTTWYEYDNRARLVGVTRSSGLSAQYSYHPQLNLVVQASYSDGRRYEYSYDDAARVVRVETSDGRILEFVYGDNGKVNRIKDSRGGRYDFTYDPDGRPVRISGKKGSYLDLEYGVTGELVGSEMAGTPSNKKRFYEDLQDVLAMLEPAAGRY